MVKGGEHKETVFTLPRNSTHLEEETSSCVLSALLIKAQSSFPGGSSLPPLDYKSKAPLPDTITFGIKISTYEFGDREQRTQTCSP